MKHPAETPRGPSISSQPSSRTVETARRETGSAALATVEEAETGVGTLPAEVQTQVDALIAALLNEAPADHDRGFRSTPEYRANAVRAGALLREYLGHTGPLGDRAGVPSATLLKYADRENVQLLAPDELHAIEQLSAALKGIGTIHRIGEEEGKRMLALVRLLRKGRLDERLSAFRTAENVTSARLSRQESRYRGVLTRDLVPDCFPAAAAEETAASVSHDAVPVVPETAAGEDHEAATAAASVAEDVPAVDAHATSPTAAVVDVASSSLTDGKTLTPAGLAVVDRLTSQSATIVELMRGIDPQDSRLAVLRTLIEQNRSILGALGIEVPEHASVPAVQPAVAAPAQKTEIAKPSVVYRTQAGAELVISSTQKGVVLILEGDAPTDGDNSQ